MIFEDRLIKKISNLSEIEAKVFLVEILLDYIHSKNTEIASNLYVKTIEETLQNIENC